MLFHVNICIGWAFFLGRWAFVRWPFVQWAFVRWDFVLVGFCPYPNTDIRRSVLIPQQLRSHDRVIAVYSNIQHVL